MTKNIQQETFREKITKTILATIATFQGTGESESVEFGVDQILQLISEASLRVEEEKVHLLDLKVRGLEPRSYAEGWTDAISKFREKLKGGE